VTLVAKEYCNAGAGGTETLLALGRPFVGFEVTSGSHCDAEGGSGNPVGCAARVQVRLLVPQRLDRIE
jgi:hypothetical protein